MGEHLHRFRPPKLVELLMNDNRAHRFEKKRDIDVRLYALNFLLFPREWRRQLICDFLLLASADLS